jgi:hypothetical protein
MKQGLRRPIQVYIYHGLWIVLTALYAIKNSSDFGRWTLIVMAIVGTVSFISILAKRNYFEVKDNKLIINKDYFRTQLIELDKIEKFDIEPGPFGSSKIILKDQTKIKFLDSQTDQKELKDFMGQFDIPVE